MLKKILFILLLLGVTWPLTAYQQAPFVRCSSPPPSGPGGSPTDPALGCTLTDLLAVPVRIYNFLLGMAAAVLLIVIIWSGMRMLLFYLSESPEGELANAKLTLTRGIFGFMIIAAGYVIVQLVLVTLLDFDSGSFLGVLLQAYF